MTATIRLTAWTVLCAASSAFVFVLQGFGVL